MEKKETPEVQIQELEEQIKEESRRARQIQKRQELILCLDAIIHSVILATFAVILQCQQQKSRFVLLEYELQAGNCTDGRKENNEVF